MSNNKSKFNRWCQDKQKGNIMRYNDDRLFLHYALLAKNRFRWENLPKGIESRHIEEFLFENGELCFYEDPNLGLISLPSAPSGQLNVYGDPLQVTLWGIGYSEQTSIDNVVRVLSNDDVLPNACIIAFYADLMNETETTMYKNLKQQKYPYIIPCTKNNRLTMVNLFKQIDEGEEAIFTDSKLSEGGSVGVEVLQTNAPYLLDKLQQFKNDVSIELLTFLGLNNTNTDKKERMLVDEVNVNNGQILMNLDIEYKNRLLACEQINKKFGLNITVKKVIEELEEKFTKPTE